MSPRRKDQRSRMSYIDKKKAQKLLAQLGKVVASASADSALEGLTRTAITFSVLLDIYSLPNAENPEGMCDDPAAFRKHFADIIATGIVPTERAA
jgi:hypothetical protein